MRRLSGLHTTLASAALVDVSLRAAVLPSAGTIQRSERCSFSLYAGSVTEKTTNRPSGLRDGDPTRGISQSASCVTGGFPCALVDGRATASAQAATAVASHLAGTRFIMRLLV